MNLLSMLTVLFVALKLIGYISWSWVAVLAPLWLPALVLFILAIATAVLKELD